MKFRRFRAANIVAIYATFGCLWILLSDTVMGWIVQDHDLLSRLGLFKGLLFIAVTATLLHFLISRHAQESIRAEQAAIESEEKFRTLVEQAPDAILVYDVSLHRYIEANRNAELLFACGREEILHADPLSFYHAHQPNGESVSQTASLYQTDALGGKELLFERLVNRNGESPRLCEIRMVRLPSPRRELLRVSFVDITDRRREQQALAQAKDDAEAANHAKDRFLAALSHELRTPLTPVLAILSSWERHTPSADEVREAAGMMRHHIELEARLIGDLLDVTRVAQGKMRLEARELDLHDIILQALETVRPEITHRGLEVDLHLDASQSHVMGDAVRLQQVFWNILNNAAKFTPSGGRIAICSCDRDDTRIEVAITDTGVGIAPEMLGQLFHAFVQVEDKSGRRAGGLGLGMAISRSLVELHGGQIQAQSNGVNQGATFRVVLKTCPSLRTQPTDHKPLPPSSLQHKDLRILLVEDNLTTCRVLARLLGKCGHSVSAVGTLKDALDLGCSQPFDLLLSDIGLPDGSGLDIMRELRKRRLPGIALTGYGMESDVQASRDAGFSAHLTKPVDMDRLERTIQDVWCRTPEHSA